VDDCFRGFEMLSIDQKAQQIFQWFRSDHLIIRGQSKQCCRFKKEGGCAPSFSQPPDQITVVWLIAQCFARHRNLAFSLRKRVSDRSLRGPYKAREDLMTAAVA